MTETLVLYHDECIDGFTAAWAVFRRLGHIDTQYKAVRHGEPPPDVTGKNVVIVDFSYKAGVLVELEDKAESILVLDHHKTAQEDLRGLPFAHFDMERSGAGMAWDHFHPDRKRPWLIDYVEDRDLWRFKLENSKTINAWIGAQTRGDFSVWTTLEAMGKGAALHSGLAVEVYIHRYVTDMRPHVRGLMVDGHHVPVINAPFINVSELLHELAVDEWCAVAWFQQADSLFRYSLRSDAQGADVSAIAKKYGGGGHKNSAGFTSNLPPWDLF